MVIGWTWGLFARDKLMPVSSSTHWIDKVVTRALKQQLWDVHNSSCSTNLWIAVLSQNLQHGRLPTLYIPNQNQFTSHHQRLRVPPLLHDYCWDKTAKRSLKNTSKRQQVCASPLDAPSWSGQTETLCRFIPQTFDSWTTRLFSTWFFSSSKRSQTKGFEMNLLFLKHHRGLSIMLIFTFQSTDTNYTRNYIVDYYTIYTML